MRLSRSLIVSGVTTIAITSGSYSPAAAAIITTDSGIIPLGNGHQTEAQIVAAWQGSNGGQLPVNTATDLLINHLAGSPSYTGSLDYGSQLKNINDGLMVSDGGMEYDTLHLTSFRAGGSLVFQLDDHYNLSSIQAFGAYGSGRLGQNYLLDASADGGATWSPLYSVNIANVTPVSGVYSVRGISVIDDGDGTIAGNVNALRFTFSDPAGGDGEAVYSEIAAYGTAVPEPGALSLLAIGTVALSVRRRAKKVG